MHGHSQNSSATNDLVLSASILIEILTSEDGFGIPDVFHPEYRLTLVARASDGHGLRALRFNPDATWSPSEVFHGSKNDLQQADDSDIVVAGMFRHDGIQIRARWWYTQISLGKMMILDARPESSLPGEPVDGDEVGVLQAEHQKLVAAFQGMGLPAPPTFTQAQLTGRTMNRAERRARNKKNGPWFS